MRKTVAHQLWGLWWLKLVPVSTCGGKIVFPSSSESDNKPALVCLSSTVSQYPVSLHQDFQLCILCSFFIQNLDINQFVEFKEGF